MNEARLIELLVALHAGLPRLGPGSEASTLRALVLCEGLGDAPSILDVGCGTGAQTLVLARHLREARIVAADLADEFLQTLDLQIQRAGLGDRVETRRADMNALPFPEASFDLVWSEGAAYVMGFDRALEAWRPLVKPAGYLALSEIAWFRADPPAELEAFWREQYPAIRSVEENLEAALAGGWAVAGHFHLPPEAWTESYYGPLKERLAQFRRERADDPDAQAVADMTEHEIALMSAHLDVCGYEFFVLRRTDQGTSNDVSLTGP
ncbi:MAG: class I SAM-dependent methyltransferase [Planctomycetota bacterium]|jgi:SAM-dependent methyltransferase